MPCKDRALFGKRCPNGNISCLKRNHSYRWSLFQLPEKVTGITQVNDSEQRGIAIF